MKRFRHSFTAFLQRQSTRQIAIGSTGLLGIIWLLDYVITVDIGLSVFYTLPIAMLTWYLHPKLGYGACWVSACLWFVAERARIVPETAVPFLVWNTLVRFIFFIIVVSLLAELKAAYQQQQSLANTDGLTQILNRRAFVTILEKEILRSRRHNFTFTLAYLDVDNFKHVNDQLGHAAGDRLLADIAIVLQQSVRAVDYQARLGGDEFVLLMPQTDKVQATITLERLFSHLSTIDTYTPSVGFSVGAVTFVTSPASADEALEISDRLMYSVKTSGKHQLLQQEY